MKRPKMLTTLAVLIIVSLITNSSSALIEIDLAKGFDQSTVIHDSIANFLIKIPKETEYYKIHTRPAQIDEQITFNLGPEENPSYSTGTIKQYKGGNTLLFVKNTKKEQDSTIYMTLTSTSKETTINLQCLSVNESAIKSNEEVQTSLSMHYPYIWRPESVEDTQKTLFFYAIGSDLNDFNITLKPRNNEQIMDTLIGEKMFLTGYGIKMDLSKLSIADFSQFDIRVTIKISKDQYQSEDVKFGVKAVSDGAVFDGAVLNYSSEMIGYVDKENPKSCYSIPLDSAHPERDVIVNILSYPDPVIINIYSEAKTLLLSIKPLSSDSKRMEFKKEAKHFCVESSNSELPFNTYSIEVFDIATYEAKQSFLSPIFNGHLRKYYLPKGKALGFRRKRFAEANENTNIYLSSITGTLSLYSYNCLSFPCSINQQLINKDKLPKAIRINDAHHLFNLASVEGEDSFYHKEKLMGIVSCEEVQEKDCEFYLTMKYNHEVISLIHNQYQQDLVSLGGMNTYSFDLNQNIIADSVSFKLHSITGDAKLSVTPGIKLTGVEHFHGNTKITTYTKNTTQQVLATNYTIDVVSNDFSYYSIIVNCHINSIKDPIIMPSAETKMMTIAPKDNGLIYRFTNRAIPQEKTYAISISSLNCALQYLINSGNEIDIPGYAQILVDKNHQMYADAYYDIEIKAKKPLISVTEESDFVCMFHISGIEIDNNSQLLLSESSKHEQDLAKDKLTKMSYYYPLYYGGVLNQVIIDISFYEKNSPLTAIVKFEGRTSSAPDKVILNRGKKLVYRKLLNYCQENNVCKLLIDIEANPSLLSALTYSISVKTSENVPVYIQNEQYYKSIVDLNSIHYSYTDIAQNTEGEVMVSFNKGNGVVFGSLVAKEAIDPNGWNNHAELPSKNLDPSKMLPFDYLNKRIRYSKEDTAKCVKGCELIVGAKSEIQPNSEIEPSNISEFSIVIRGLGLELTKLTINEYGYGSLTDKDDADVYYIKIPFDTDEIRIHLSSDFGVAYINKGQTLPSKDKSDLVITDSNGIYTIHKTDPLISSASLKGFEFTIAIQATDFCMDFSKYSIKVSASIQNIPALNYLTSEQNEVCVFDSKHKYANLIRSVNSYEGITDFYMTIESIDNPHNSFRIYVNIIEAEDFESKFNFDDLPKKNQCHLSSENSPNKNLLHFNNTITDKMKGNYYIVISVFALQQGKGLFFSSSMRNIIKTSLNQNTKTLFRMTKEELFGFHLNGERSLVSVTLIYGNGKIVISEEKQITFEDSIIMELTNNESDVDFSVKPLTDELVYYVKYFTITSGKDKPQFKELAFGRDNHIVTDKVTFNDAYFFKVQTSPEDKVSVMINLKFTDYQIEGTTVKGTEEFELNAYVIEEEFVHDAMKDPSKKPPETSKAFKGSYSPLSRIGTILINQFNANANSQARYLYVEMIKSKSNENTYTRLIPSISSSPISNTNSIYSFPNNNYYYNKIEKSSDVNVLKLIKYNRQDKKMVIEFANCVDESLMDFSIRNYTELAALTDPNLKVNDTKIQKTTLREYGKVIIELDVENYDSIAFVVFSKTTSDIPLSYAIKYKTAPEIKQESDITFPNATLGVAYDINNTLLQTSWIPPKVKKHPDSQEAIKDIEYVYRVFNRSSKPVLSSSICLLMENQNGISKRLSYKENIDRINIKDEIKLENGTYEVSVVALFLDEVEEEKLFAYERNSIKIGEDPASDPEKNDHTFVWYIVGGAVTLVILMISGFFIVRMMRKRKMKHEQDHLLNGPNMPLI